MSAKRYYFERNTRAVKLVGTTVQMVKRCLLVLANNVAIHIP